MRQAAESVSYASTPRKYHLASLHTAHSCRSILMSKRRLWAMRRTSVPRKSKKSERTTLGALPFFLRNCRVMPWTSVAMSECRRVGFIYSLNVRTRQPSLYSTADSWTTSSFSSSPVVSVSKATTRPYLANQTASSSLAFSANPTSLPRVSFHPFIT